DPPHCPRVRALRSGFGICNCSRPCRSAPATKRPWQSGLAGRKGRLLRVPPLRRLPAPPLLLASPVLPALLRIWLLPAVSLWLLEPALLSARVVVFCPRIRTGRPPGGPDRCLSQHTHEPLSHKT